MSAAATRGPTLHRLPGRPWKERRTSLPRSPSPPRLAFSLLLSVLLFPAPVSAQGSPTADLRLSQDRITVGEHFQLFVKTTYPTDLVVKMPGSEQEMGPFEIVDLQWLGPDQVDGEQLSSSSVYTLTAFETGNLEIPSIAIGYVSTDGSREGRIETDPVTVSVQSVVTDEGSEIRDVKPPLEMPRDWRPVLLALLGLAVLGAAGFWAFRRYSRRQLPTPGIVEAGLQLPPHVLALQELERLKQSDLLDRGEVKRFHVEVSEIIRRYFEGRYGIDALEMTSAEILHRLPPQLESVVALSASFLTQCDLVKFARFLPSRTGSDRALGTAFEIVESTRPPETGITSSGLPAGSLPPGRPLDATGGTA